MTEIPNRPLARIIRVEQAKSWIDGFAFLELAKAEAAAIRSEAEADASRVREAAREEGRKEGELEAAAIAMRAQVDVDLHLASIEPLMAGLAMQIVERVIGTLDNAELVARAARQALDDLRDERSVVVSVAPELADEVHQRLGELGPMAMTMRVSADRHLSARRCMVTTPATSIDVSIDVQLDAIRAAMVGRDPSCA
ncbi:HrpE/YscL family type III secretion apparatus protein (plasmid) [Rhizobium leguminosarum]|uniref:FliH/SctL family protein n=1 Tax=Rhizobium TaxID=379 RepID=UPI001030EAD6|nr:MULTISPECIES: FliH/SctL family protein [Rhizobium]MBY5378375.1 HrpE/YscL family type III secretion apparatus protein [Rhizobium leguminosarum]TBF35124.1 HrpE/YscL family type III secretion apparatus protein [Rhizobium leguminosarum]TBF87976.1 HrpE/YscL family type III secretion apparatus protein [Rhizobium leguminosarum]WSH48665.1 FliH/SctL family protein [Rhizobium johnstonii]